jgi:phosphoglycerate dehydrogenase-like enzyme
MDQVVVTPHIAGAAPERADRNAQLVLENLKRFVDGKPLASVVDRELGY